MSDLFGNHIVGFSTRWLIYGPMDSGAATLLSTDGSTFLTAKEAILERWAEHFKSVSK